jgi:hypothetical protein
MSSLKERIELLENDLKAVPQRISVYHDLPFAILRYEPTEEWDLRREVKLLATRLEGIGKAVHIISMSEFLWRAIDETEGLDEVVTLERSRGYLAAQDQVTTYLSDRDWRPLAGLLAERLAKLDPSKSIVLLTRVAAMAPGTGQQWTDLDRLRLTHRNSLKFKEPGLIGVGVEPHFAIGQWALFLRTPKANVLWDCVPLLDEAVVEAIKSLGGISAIAISHPHYYSSMVEWSRAFGGVPIYLHAADKQWVMRPDNSIVYWEGETKELGEGLTLVRCGGHFEGGTVLHWAGGANGRGALLTGDKRGTNGRRKTWSCSSGRYRYKRGRTLLPTRPGLCQCG